jgi:hypothetical protein
MKKLLVVLFTILLLVGCGKKEETIESKKLADDEVMLEEILYKFDQDAEYHGLKYKVASNLRLRDTGNAYNYFSEEIDGSSYFVFRIFYYGNKDIDYAVKDTTDNTFDSRKETKVGDLDYTVVRFKNPIGENTYTNIYYYKNNSDVYAFCFTSAIDVSRLEEVFLKHVIYPDN